MLSVEGDLRERNAVCLGTRLKSAKFLVAGGQGLGRAELFEMLEHLASMLVADTSGRHITYDFGVVPAFRGNPVSANISPRTFRLQRGFQERRNMSLVMHEITQHEDRKFGSQ